MPTRAAMNVVALLVTSTILILNTGSSQAQVTIQRGASGVIIENRGAGPQHAVKSEDGWQVLDQSGSSYEACNTQCWQEDDGTWTCSGYESSDGVDPQLVNGYPAATAHLVEHYGAVVKRDEVLDVDVVSFPEAADPYETLLDALLNDYLDGRPLVDYFKSIEIASIGKAGVEYQGAKPRGGGHDFPNDEFYSSQWGLEASNLARALWHPFTPKIGRALRVAIIDSGINAGDLEHSGLDGVSVVHHRQTARTTGFALSHGLSLATLLSDAGHDSRGPVGLLGTWGNRSCDGRTAVFDRQPVEVYSYNVGDFGPVSNLVARAIAVAIEDEVDVINLSLRIAYSPLVEQLIRDALSAGIVVVAAAGNFHAGSVQKPTGFPANLDGVIAVSSGNRSLSLSSGTANTGYDIVAPGVDIVVGGPGDIWRYGSGSSFAAPHVVAAAALMKGARPGITSSEVLAVLVATAAKGPKEVAFLDALAALNAVLPPEERAFNVSLPQSCDITGKAGQDNRATATLPLRPVLLSNYPNPFNPETAIHYALPGEHRVRLQIFDVMGRVVQTLVDGLQESGEHAAIFNAGHLPSGVYFSRLEVDGEVLSGRMLLLK